MPLEWLYPELERIDPKGRVNALNKAKVGWFDAVELVGIGIALVLAVGLTRYSAAGMGLVARVGVANNRVHSGTSMALEKGGVHPIRFILRRASQ